jgi:hypothetical protein
MDGISCFYLPEVAAADRDNAPTYHTFDDAAEPSHRGPSSKRHLGRDFWGTDPAGLASPGDVVPPPDLVPESPGSLPGHSRYPPSYDGQTREPQGAGTAEHSNGPDWMFLPALYHPYTWNTTAHGYDTPEYDDAYVLVGADTSPPPARVSKSQIYYPTCFPLK